MKDGKETRFTLHFEKFDCKRLPRPLLATSADSLRRGGDVLFRLFATTQEKQRVVGGLPGGVHNLRASQQLLIDNKHFEGPFQ